MAGAFPNGYRGEMIEDDVKALVVEHYQDPNAGILLLSDIGMKLTKSGVWPPANDKRSLYDVAEDTPGITPRREDDAKSFIPVVLEGDEQRAVKAFNARRQRFYLRSYPRALLLAFTIDMADGQVMSLRLGPKISYQGGPALEEGTILVDNDLRIPGIDVLDAPSLTDEQIDQLDTNIRAWCERHHVDQSSLMRVPGKTRAPAPEARPVQGSALERLYAAQEPDVAKRLTVPIDIALALSRMP